MIDPNPQQNKTELNIPPDRSDSLERHIWSLRKTERRKKIAGVYFLWDGPDIVYIGQSLDVEGRVDGHKKKDFTHWSCLEVDPEELTRISDWEAFLIRFYSPKYNKDYPKRSTISINRIIERISGGQYD